MSSNGKNGTVTRGGSAMPPLEQVFKGRRILVTGATGFLGKVFLAMLLRWHPKIEKIYLLIRGDRRSSVGRYRREILDSPAMTPVRGHLGADFDGYVEEKIVVVPGDITNAGLLGDEAKPFKPGVLDAVVHSAGLVNFEASLEKAVEVNTSGVTNVIEFCTKAGAALMHISTCYVAGIADGHRYEDEIPENWCPNGRKSFRLEREVRDALAAIARVEAESRDQVRHAEFRGDDDLEGAENPRESAIEHRRKQWVEERLKEVGRKRAQSWGWPNTYSYTKSLGEQLVLGERERLNVTVVRPAVIESALRDPFPGWNQGVNTSAPLTYLAGRGYRFYPAKAELVLDVIPVDLAAHAMIPILGALLLRKQKPVYQVCTSDRNPLPMRRLVELTGLIRDVVGAENQSAKKIESGIKKFKENTDIARELLELYRPYIQELVYTFHAGNIRALYATLKPVDAERHQFRPDLIDWRDYWINIHLPGLRRHIFPQLDLHTRGRPKSLPRHRNLVDMLDRAADRYGSSVAMIARRPSGEQTQTTYRELRDKAHRAALLLAMRGIKPGDRVLLIGEN